MNFNQLFFGKKNYQMFVSSLTHDLKVPLSVARLNMEMAKRISTEEQVTTRITKSLAQIERLEQMINDLLDVSLLQAGKSLPIHIQFIDLCKIAVEVVESMKFLHGDHFKLSCPDNLYGYWCPKGMRRLFENLITNAVKHGEKDSPITISLEDLGESISLQFSNQGPAMPPSTKNCIFDPYIRLQQKREGWGLGLATVKEIVKMHRGAIDVQSKENVTTFEIKLPKALEGQVH